MSGVDKIRSPITISNPTTLAYLQVELQVVLDTVTHFIRILSYFQN